MIEGVQIHPLKQIVDERGKVMRMLKRNDPWFQQFGEIYFSVVNPGMIKGWHLHKSITLNYTVVSGLIKLVLYDNRSFSKTNGVIQEIFIGEGNYALVTIPTSIWNGFKGISSAPAIVANCSTEPYDGNATEMERESPFSNRIPYDWDVKHG